MLGFNNKFNICCMFLEKSIHSQSTYLYKEAIFEHDYLLLKHFPVIIFNFL